MEAALRCDAKKFLYNNRRAHNAGKPVDKGSRPDEVTAGSAQAGPRDVAADECTRTSSVLKVLAMDGRSSRDVIF